MTEIKLSKPWEKFLIKLSTYKDFDILQWQEWHLVGYFMDKYYDHFKRKFSLSLQGPPGKCTEIVMMKKIAYSIGSIQKSVEYIDWIFEEKIKKKNVSVNTVGFLMTKGVINEYLKQKEKKEKITRFTEIPAEYKQLSDYYNVPVSTYGDLLFIKKALEEDSKAESRQSYQKLFNQLCSIGFKEDILETL